ncbi:histone deacetylase complex protein [Desarmillaria ectypa]|nr:histone deacetylase complex protein [Desarmillaria ectypa]
MVVYIVGSQLVEAASRLPSNQNRSKIVHSLVNSLGLLKKAQVIRPVPATHRELREYHTDDYLDVVLDDNASSSMSHGLTDDCPIFRGLPSYVQLVAGATLTAVKALQITDVAICWDGGRHHAQKSAASGFCYVADCVLAILAMRRIKEIHHPRPRIMYIDLDLHFSDAVSQAFYLQNSVLTLSIHHASPGFFPVSPLAPLQLPSQSDPSFDPFTLSLPLQPGASCLTYMAIFPLVQKVTEVFAPTHVIVQCGVDALSEDPHAMFNWSLSLDQPGSMGYYIHRILTTFPGKKLLLGGGGYNSPNAARAWAYLTSVALSDPLPINTEIPYDHPFFPLYAPSFTLDVPEGTMQDQNTPEYLSHIIDSFMKHIIPALENAITPKAP